MRMTLTNSTVKNFDTIVIRYRGLGKTVVGPVGTPSSVRLSHVLGVNIKCWYDHFDTRGPVGTPSSVRPSHVLGVNIKCWYDHFDTRVLVS